MDSENSTENVIENLHEINHRQEDRIHNLEAKAIQLANLYFVFQGVILSTVSSVSSLHCHHWWIPFSLSFLAALLNLLTFGSTMFAYLKCSEGFDQNMEDLAFASQRLDRRNIAETSSTPQGGGRRIRGTKPDPFRKFWRRSFALLGVLFFVSFSGIMLYGCYAILCDPSVDADKCVKDKVSFDASP